MKAENIPHWIGIIVIAGAALYGFANYVGISLPTHSDIHGVQWGQHDHGYNATHIPSNWEVIR